MKMMSILTSELPFGLWPADIWAFGHDLHLQIVLRHVRLEKINVREGLPSCNDAPLALILAKPLIVWCF